jgi:hypothetical protein
MFKKAKQTILRGFSVAIVVAIMLTTLAGITIYSASSASISSAGQIEGYYEVSQTDGTITGQPVATPDAAI